MTSIPYDPSLTLGSVVEIEKIEHLKKIAEAQKPLDDALERLNNVLNTQYSLKMVYNEMQNMKLPKRKLDEFAKEMEVMEQSVVAAAVNYGEKATTSYQQIEDLLNSQGQKSVSYGIESPINFERSEIKQFPLAFDALEFDVQYVRNEENEQGSSAGSHSENISKSMSDKGWGRGSFDRATMNNSTSAVTTQTENHNIEGTIVITAKADQKQADIIAPLILDPIKTVAAWNYTYPDDLVKVDANNIFKTALGGMREGGEKPPTLDIISGCSKTASFIGCVHLLKQEKTESKQIAKSTLDSVKESFKKDLWYKSMSGGFGVSDATSETAKTLLGSSAIANHANIVCNGIIPSIVVNEIPSMVKRLAPDAPGVMEQQAAIADASNAGQNQSIEGESEGGKKGAQFMALNSEFMKNSVSALAAYQNEGNKVIDINSMMTAFEDFVNKATEGTSGVPKTFYVKHLTKSDVAKVYIRKFYPNGAVSSKDRRKGMLGQADEDEDE
mmetsp:Transcript_833/g.1013  ORF Transcript_833/g.1013 Transcript_833/m.1013 type:complete len:499 (+) Transcript_833:111-1607(+)